MKDWKNYFSIDKRLYSLSDEILLKCATKFKETEDIINKLNEQDITIANLKKEMILNLNLKTFYLI